MLLDTGKQHLIIIIYTYFAPWNIIMYSNSNTENLSLDLNYEVGCIMFYMTIKRLVEVNGGWVAQQRLRAVPACGARWRTIGQHAG